MEDSRGKNMNRKLVAVHKNLSCESFRGLSAEWSRFGVNANPSPVRGKLLVKALCACRPAECLRIALAVIAERLGWTKASRCNIEMLV